LLSYNRPSRKPTLFKPFTGPSVKQFDDFYKVIESEYARHEIKPYLIIRETERKSCWSWLVDDVSNWMLMSGLSLWRSWCTIIYIPHLYLDRFSVWPWLSRSEKNFPQQKSSLPVKKEKGCELTAEQKKSTRTILQWG
jgi:hypothetical protein